MKVRWVGCWSEEERVLRLFRLVWQRGVVNMEGWYSCKLSFGLMLHWPFVRVRLHKSYGGIYV